jgi:hypothetical protein
MLKFTNEHAAILEQFRQHDGQRLSSDAIQKLTNIEPVKVNLILFDLSSHDLLQKIHLDEDSVVYMLSDHGRNFTPEHA